MSNKRKIIFVSLIFLLEIFALTACSKEKLPFTKDTDAMEKTAASVFKLEVYDSEDKRIAVGSAFCAIDGKTIVTAEHVITDMDYAIATGDSGETYRITELVVADENKDLAVCRLSEESSIDPLMLGNELPKRGEPVACIGSSAGFVNLITLGNVSGIWDAAEEDRILFTAPVSAGNSGGPLLDDNGQVLGVVIGSYERVDGMYIAISAEEIKALADSVKN